MIYHSFDEDYDAESLDELLDIEEIILKVR